MPQFQQASDELSIFRKLLNCNRRIFSWTYAEDGTLLETDSPTLFPNLLFERFGCLEYAVAYIQDTHAPVILGSHLGLMWGAVPEKEAVGGKIHVIGPCLSNHLSMAVCADMSRKLMDVPTQQKSFESLMKELPVVPVMLFYEYLLMLNLCICGEQIHISDIHLQNSASMASPPEREMRDRHQVYLTERALLHYIREGDMNYKDALSKAGQISEGIPVSYPNPIMQSVVSVSGFISLCVRAAIEGGLSPDTAYHVGDHYIQSVMECKTVTDIGAISGLMYEDFVRRVHKLRENTNYSQTIRDCIAHIEMHPEQDLSIHVLASHFEYTDYYLSRKFKKETGESLNYFINVIRVERAKFLLETTTKTVSEIALDLHFCSSTYFSDTFKSIAGISPSDFRKKARGTE